MVTELHFARLDWSWESVDNKVWLIARLSCN